VLKLMTIGRQKDAIDVLSLLLDRRNDVDLMSVAKMTEDAGLTKHSLSRVRDYARRLKEGELARIWFSVTTFRLTHIEKREMARFFAKLADLLRQP